VTPNSSSTTGLPKPPASSHAKGSGERLPVLVVLHRVRVRPHEVDERRKRSQRVAVVGSGDLDAPRAVADRDRLACAARPERLDEDPGPGRDLVGRRRPGVERHLVREQPAHDGRVPGKARRQLLGEPRLLSDEPDVAVEIATAAPRGVPVLAGHVTDDESGNRAETRLGMGIEEVVEVPGHRLVEHLGLGDEVGPEAERPRHAEAVAGEHLELGADDLAVVARPHPRPAGPRPEVRAEPGGEIAHAPACRIGRMRLGCVSGVRVVVMLVRAEVSPPFRNVPGTFNRFAADVKLRY
jgi:hypothetical protein